MSTRNRSSTASLGRASCCTASMISISFVEPKMLDQGLVGELVDARLVAAQVDRHAIRLAMIQCR